MSVLLNVYLEEENCEDSKALLDKLNLEINNAEGYVFNTNALSVFFKYYREVCE